MKIKLKNELGELIDGIVQINTNFKNTLNGEVEFELESDHYFIRATSKGYEGSTQKVYIEKDELIIFVLMKG